MTEYVSVEITVTDAGWVPEYAAEVHKLVETQGGRYLARSGNIESLEGAENAATLIAILAFPSADAVKAFATDPAYAPYGQARQAGSISRFRLIDDTDLAGTIPYLDAA